MTKKGREYDLLVSIMSRYGASAEDGIDTDWVNADPANNLIDTEPVACGSARSIIKYLLTNDPLLKGYKLVKSK